LLAIKLKSLTKRVNVSSIIVALGFKHTLINYKAYNIVKAYIFM
jgi:hypothetical protein